MCPACLAAAGLVVGGVVSSGGIAAIVVKVLGSKKRSTNDSKERSNA